MDAAECNMLNTRQVKHFRPGWRKGCDVSVTNACTQQVGSSDLKSDGFYACLDKDHKWTGLVTNTQKGNGCGNHWNDSCKLVASICFPVVILPFRVQSSLALPTINIDVGKFHKLSCAQMGFVVAGCEHGKFKLFFYWSINFNTSDYFYSAAFHRNNSNISSTQPLQSYAHNRVVEIGVFLPGLPLSSIFCSNEKAKGYPQR